MVNGTLGKRVTQANQNVTVCTLADDTQINFATINISCVNTSDQQAHLRLAICKNDTPELVDYIEYDAVLQRKSSTLERTSNVCSPGDKVIAWSDQDGVVIRVHGLGQKIC